MIYESLVNPLCKISPEPILTGLSIGSSVAVFVAELHTFPCVVLGGVEVAKGM